MLSDNVPIENLVSKEVVKKLKLRRVPHPNPMKCSPHNMINHNRNKEITKNVRTKYRFLIFTRNVVLQNSQVQYSNPYGFLPYNNLQDKL